MSVFQLGDYVINVSDNRMGIVENLSKAYDTMVFVNWYRDKNGNPMKNISCGWYPISDLKPAPVSNIVFPDVINLLIDAAIDEKDELEFIRLSKLKGSDAIGQA